MPAFTITPVEKGILRCHHTGPFSHEDVRPLAGFLHDYRGKLLIDLRGSRIEEFARNIREFQPMMPTTAIFGAKIDPVLLKIPESYYTHEVCFFETEEEALTWLRNQ
ncbi:MAG TPA: hypothetical protein VMT46_10955 [Anaerolineaceae bacterium]|nr:hypothetical protein [Anaerolineaceae bacterium]